MKRYLTTIAFAAALAFVVAALPASAANETTAKLKAKITQIKCQLKQKACECKCKKDATCKTKCGQDEKTCTAPAK
jgi:hypothetical protein